MEDGSDYPQYMDLVLQGNAKGYDAFGLTTGSLEGGADVLAMSKCLLAVPGIVVDTTYYCDDFMYISGLMHITQPGKEAYWLCFHSSGGTEGAMHYMWFRLNRNRQEELPC
ncbi:MAG: hypothetical protein IPP83_07670 [Flavobacteriales bacterium]|nr:hypothetical protein [Flavobacteriales bacterium]